MWLYTKKGFLSIVENFHDRSQFVVRSRFKNDIEAHFPDAKVEKDTGTDYKYRAFLPKKIVASTVHKYVESELDYTNYKSSVKGSLKHDAYLSVWGIMKRAQDEEEEMGSESSSVFNFST